MNLADIISLVYERGIELWIEKGNLKYHAPKGALPAEIRELLKANKDNLIEYLSSEINKNPDTYDLSYNQQFLWFQYHLAPQSPAYNVAFVARVVSPFEFPRMESVFQKLIGRHPMLRTTYNFENGIPSMKIHKQTGFSCEHIDAAGWSEEFLYREVHRRYSSPFDLSCGPIVRVQLFTRKPEDHVLLLTIHHIACDGWSIKTLVKEFCELYSGRNTELPADALSYIDFTRYQNEMVKSSEGQRLFSFWNQQLEGELPELSLPIGKQRPLVQIPYGGTYHFSIKDEFYRNIVTFARNSGTTLYTFLLASFQILLMRYSSQEDILIGTPMISRPRKGDESTIGCYINPIVLRSEVSGGSSFREHLMKTRKIFMDAFEHRDYPFPLLVKQLSPARGRGRASIFQVMFNFLDRKALGEIADLLYRDRSDASAGETVDLGDFQMKPFPMDQEEGQFDLALEIIDNDQSLTGLLKYSKDIYEEATVACMAGHFKVLLRGIIGNPNQLLSELPLLTENERHRLLVEWNNTRIDYPVGRGIHEIFEIQARQTPEAIAVEYEGNCLTYSELENRSRIFAEHLQTLGIKADELVALYVDRSLEMIVALLGILRAGGAYLPLDRMFPRDRLAYMLEDAKPRVLVTLTKFSGELPPHKATVVCVDSFPAVGAPGPLANRSDLTNLAYVLYTSGSTGNPKGVQITHGALVNFLNSMRKAPGMNSRDVLLSVTTISFDILGLEIWLPLSTGARVVLVPQEAGMDGKRLSRVMAECNVTVMQATPATWRLLLESGWAGSPALKILCGGEAWSQDLADLLLPKCASLWNMYGPTETTIWSSASQVCKGDAVLIGRPIANTRFYVVDSHLQPLPAGVPGELLIGGDGLARGYLNRPELTAEKFIPDPFHYKSGSRLYRTGDLVRYLPDGRLEFIARLDQQVKIRGYRIELGEIESLLCENDWIRQSAVMVHEYDGEKRIVAYIVPQRGSKQSTVELRDHLRQKLPDYMVPADYVILSEMPLTPNGKVNRRALPVPERTRQTEKVYLPPKGEVEVVISKIWSDILHVQRVGLDDNFFDLGGYSLLLARVAARLSDTFNKDISIMDLFQHPTVRGQAVLVGGTSRNPSLQNSLTGGTGRESHFLRRSPSKLPEDSPKPGSSGRTEAIAVIGMSCRFPSASSVDSFWSNLRDGVESIRYFTDQELSAMGVPAEIYNDPNYVKATPFLEDIDMFDAAFFGYAPREAEIMDPQQRIFLECAWSALEDAGYDPGTYSGSIGIIGGSSPSYYGDYFFSNIDEKDVMGTYLWELGNEKDYLATRVAYKLNLRGPCLNIQTACSTSLVAVHIACQNLLTNQCDMALAGGASINTRIRGGYLYREGMIYSPDGHCRAFDSKAQGLVQGQGAGIVVLKRLSDALADGDRIRALIRGSSINNDGSFKIGFTAPNIDGQAEAIAIAQTIAGVSAEDISYVEAHGSGTPLGDPIEVKALTKAFRLTTGKKGFCGIGSVKTNIGHLDTAAGIAGFIKTVLMLEHREIPPSLHFKTPNPNLDLHNSPFFVNTKLREWQSGGKPRRAGVSSFGIGGTNAHAILEEAPVPEPSDPPKANNLLCLSARTKESLDAVTANMVSHLKNNRDLNLSDVAFTLHAGRKAFEHRRSVVCSGTEDAIAALESAVPKRVVTSACGTGNMDVVFMFPGHGSQYVNMGKELYKEEQVFRQQIDLCSEILQKEISADLRDLLYPEQDRIREADEKLRQTSIFQPVLLAVELALARLWMTWGIYPDVMVGHSIGEFTAACLAGVFSLEDTLKLVAARGRLMQEMPQGSMLDVFLCEEELMSFIDEDLSLSAVNGPSLCEVSGFGPAIDRFESVLSAKQLGYRRLRTSHALHSKMMDPILTDFAELVQRTGPKPPNIPFLSNVTGTLITSEEATDPVYWAKQLRSTVRFADCVQELLRETNKVLLEAGPGRTLSMLANQHPAKQINHIVLSSMRNPKEKVADNAVILETLALLWHAGSPVDWSGFYAGTKRQRVSLPTYHFERKRYWIRQEAQAGGTLNKKRGIAKKKSKIRENNNKCSVEEKDTPASCLSAEDRLADIWRDLLGHCKINPEDDFFIIGGDSLIGAALIEKINESFKVKLPITAIFEHRTLSKLALLIQQTAINSNADKNLQKEEEKMMDLVRLVG